MNHIASRLAVGFLAAAIGLTPMAFAAAADMYSSKTGQVRAKSPAAKAPLIGRIVVKPTSEQMAKIRGEKRMIRQESRTAVARQATSGPAATTGAI